jgi:hypothetical protein
MSWLDRLNGRTSDDDAKAPWARRVAALVQQRRFREAAAELDASATPVPAEVHDRVARAASEHWLADAELACQEGDRARMNMALAEAARWYRDAFGPLFRDTRRRIRQHTLELTAAGHWVALLHAASDSRSRSDGRVPESWRAFANARLIEDAAFGDHDVVEAIERLDHVALERVRPRLTRHYPDALRARIEAAPAELVRAALLVAACRPDLAVVPLLEVPDTDPVVCLERARVAWALGFPNTALLALGDFAAHQGAHLTVRRLNTGVFMAQMAVACGDEARAVEILEGIDVLAAGRRPVLLHARLLARVGREHDGARVLDDWLVAHPDDHEARALLEDLAGPDPTEDGLLEEAPRSDGPPRR